MSGRAWFYPPTPTRRDERAKSLLAAIEHCALYGVVPAGLGETGWSVVADTKLEDSDRYFPVIVTFRGDLERER